MEGQLLPLTSDYVFKRIFGQEENILNIQWGRDRKTSSIKYKKYVTSEDCDLSYNGEVNDKVVIPARSLVTLVAEIK